jgi:hypothetical protein
MPIQPILSDGHFYCLNLLSITYINRKLKSMDKEENKPTKKTWVKPEIVLISSGTIEKGIYRDHENTVHMTSNGQYYNQAGNHAYRGVQSIQHFAS